MRGIIYIRLQSVFMFCPDKITYICIWIGRYIQRLNLDKTRCKKYRIFKQ